MRRVASRSRRLGWTAGALAAGLVALAAAGCGVKGRPRPPAPARVETSTVAGGPERAPGGSGR